MVHTPMHFGPALQTPIIQQSTINPQMLSEINRITNQNFTVQEVEQQERAQPGFFKRLVDNLLYRQPAMPTLAENQQYQENLSNSPLARSMSQGPMYMVGQTGGILQDFATNPEVLRTLSPLPNKPSPAQELGYKLREYIDPVLSQASSDVQRGYNEQQGNPGTPNVAPALGQLSQAVPVQAEEIANYLEKVDSEQNYPNTPPPSVVPAIRRFNPNIDAPILAPAPITENGVLSDTPQPVAEQTMVAAATAADEAAASTPGTRNSKSIGATSAIASASPKTGNARGSQMGYGFRPGDLMRIGMAIMGGAGQGFGAAMGAGSQALGQVQNEIRDEQAAAEQLARLEEQQQAEREQELMLAQYRAQRTGGGAGGGSNSSRSLSQEDQEQIGKIDDTIFSYQQALDALRDGDNLTGPGGMIKGFFDNFTGDDDAARRLILERVKVDDALLRVANTKGAISNKEMQLFLAPAPKNWQDESVWNTWLLDRLEAAQNVRNRLLTGETVPIEDRYGYTPVGEQTSSTPDAPAQSSAAGLVLEYDPETGTFNEQPAE